MFKRRKSAKQLSADELKSKLYAHFDKSGSLNQLRTQVRSQLVSELFKIAPPSTEITGKSTELTNFGKSLLPLQVCHWLIYDHLSRQGYQYSLSTFVSETNIPYPEKLLAAGDILALFGLDSSTQEYKKISEMYSPNNDKGYLHSLLLAVIKSLLDMSNRNNQTNEHDKQYANATGEVQMETKFPLYGEKLSQEIDNTEPCTIDPLKDPKVNVNSSFEVSFQEQLHYVKEEKEKEIQKLRHKLLEELDRLHSQERALQLEMEQERKEVKRDRDLLFTEKEKLKEKQLLFEKELENRFEKKVKDIEEIHALKLHSKGKEIEILQKKLQDKEQKLGQMEFELSSHKERFDALQRELADVNHMYKSIHEKYNTLLDENTTLVKKFENMSDYNIIKEELSAKSKEIVSLRQEIENMQRLAEKNKKAYTETVTNLELKLRATEPQLHQVQKDLCLTKDALQMEEAVWNKERNKLEQELLTLQELYRTVLQRMEEQKQDIKDLHQTIHILHYQFTNKDLNPATKSERYDSVRTIPKVSFLPSNTTRAQKSDKNSTVNLDKKYRDDALNFTADYKNRLSKLQQQAEAGFDKYSLIYCSSLDSKTPNANPSFPCSSSSFTRNVTLNSPSLTKHFTGISPNFSFTNTSKTFIPSTDFNLKSRNSKHMDHFNRNDLLKQARALVSNKNLQNSTHMFSPDNKAMVKKSTASDNEADDPHFVYQTGLLSQKSPEKYKSNFSVIGDSNEFLEYETSHSMFRTSNELFQKEFISRGISEEVLKSSPQNINPLEPNKIASEMSSTDYHSHIPNTESVILASEINSPSHDTLSNAIATQPENKKVSSYQSSDIELDIVNSAEHSQIGKSLSQNSHISDKEEIIASPNVKNILTNEFNQATEHSMGSLAQLRQEESTVETSSINQSLSQETVPMIVDLDAAWKRKASLPPVLTPFQNTNLLKSHNEILIPETKENKNSMLFSKKEASDKFTSKSQDTFNKEELGGRTETSSKMTHDAETQNERNTVVHLTSSNISNVVADSTSVKEIGNTTEITKNSSRPTNTEEHLQSGTLQNQHVEVDGRKLSLLSDKSNTDEDVKQNSSADVSEVHMSCGSEKEEQKEESDNW